MEDGKSKTPFLLGIKDMEDRLDDFPEDLENSVFSVHTQTFLKLVRVVGERVGGLFVSYLVKKEKKSGKNCFYLYSNRRQVRTAIKFEDYSMDVVKAFNMLSRGVAPVPDAIVIKCHPESLPGPGPRYEYNPNCLECKEIYQFKKVSGTPDWHMGSRTRTKDSCGKLDEIVCYEIRASVSRFKSLTPRQKILLRNVKELNYARLYLIKIDITDFSKNIFHITVEG